MPKQAQNSRSLESLTKAELQAEARTRGLPFGGTRADLLDRLRPEDGAKSSEGEGATAGRGEEDAEREGRAKPAEGRGDEDAGEAGRESGQESRADEAGGESRPEPAEDAGKERPEPAEDAGKESPAADESPDNERSREESRSDGESRAAERSRGEPRALSVERLDELGSGVARFLEQLTKRPIEGVAGVRPTETGYAVTVDVLDLSRVPSTTDVLATYEVECNRDGEVISYGRLQRYYRNMSSG